MLPQPSHPYPIVTDPQKASYVSDTVRLAQSGNHEAFKQLYRDNVGRVYAVCMRIVRDTRRAEELTQDAFVRAWEMLPTYRGEAEFSSWLHRLAVNVVLVDIRSTKRRTERVSIVEDLTTLNHANPDPRDGISVDLEKAIASLPSQARTIFVLHDIEGYQHQEIAELLGLATGTSKAQLHRARRLLREVLNS